MPEGLNRESREGLNMRTTWLWKTVAGLVVAGAMARAGEILPPSKLADLDLPLTVQESAGVERKGDLCSTGVPLPLGLIQEPEGIALYDGKGAAVPAQFRVLERWLNFGEDKSLKWLLVTFLADVPKDGKAVYHLRAGKNPEISPTARIDRDERASAPLSKTHSNWSLGTNLAAK